MKHFTDTLFEGYENEFKPNWVELSIEPWRFNYLAKGWNWPKNDYNQELLPKEEWEKLRELFVDAGKNIEVNKNAEIISTYYGKFGKFYLVWLEFMDKFDVSHKIDVYVNELGKNSKNAEKHIDPRSPLCEEILEAITTTGYISTDVVKLLPAIGAKTWTSSTEEKLQYKLNSFKQCAIFEDACLEVGVQYEQLDPFDNNLYRGDPGRLADYDLTFSNRCKIRVDLKLLSKSELSVQNPHDAEIMIGSNLNTSETSYYKVAENEEIENNPQFIRLLEVFSRKLKEAGPCFIKISNIDLDTGKVDFEYFR